MVMSVINGVTTYYPDDNYIVEDNNSTITVTKTYFANTAAIAIRTIVDAENTLHWLLTDHLGSSSITTTADGTWNSEIRYTPYGETRYSSGITSTDFRYTGQLQQADINLYFYNARWYDPALGRFIQPDSIAPESFSHISYNRYAYANNNPIQYVDPSGHFAWVIAGAAVGAAISYGFQVYTNYQNGYTGSEAWTSNIDGTAIVGGALMGAGAVICAPAVIGLAGDAMVGVGLWTGSTGMFMAGQSAYQAATIVEANIVYGSPGKTLPINTYSDKFSEVTASDYASQASGQPITLSRETDKALIKGNRYNATGSYPTMDNYQSMNIQWHHQNRGELGLQLHILKQLYMGDMEGN